MKVDEFGFGFPPRLIGVQKSGGRFRWVLGHRDPEDTESTVYSINAIPLGGFVKIVGEDNEQADDSRSFINRPFLPRFITLAAGIIMNLVLGWFLISIGYMVGLPVAIDDFKQVPAYAQVSDQATSVIEVVAGSPAETAGMKAGDNIVTIDNQVFDNLASARQYIVDHKGETLTFTVRRGNEQLDLPVQSLAEPPSGQGPTGISLLTTGRLSYPWYAALWAGAQTTVSQVWGIVRGLGAIIFTGEGLNQIGGPVKIAQLTGQVADLGFVYLLQFTALLSLNLAVLNSVPFPALDGGRILFLAIEKIRGKRNNQKIEQYANAVGFLLLLLVMLTVTVKDLGFFS